MVDSPMQVLREVRHYVLRLQRTDLGNPLQERGRERDRTRDGEVLFCILLAVLAARRLDVVGEHVDGADEVRIERTLAEVLAEGTHEDVHHVRTFETVLGRADVGEVLPVPVVLDDSVDRNVELNHFAFVGLSEVEVSWLEGEERGGGLPAAVFLIASPAALRGPEAARSTDSMAARTCGGAAALAACVALDTPVVATSTPFETAAATSPKSKWWPFGGEAGGAPALEVEPEGTA